VYFNLEYLFSCLLCVASFDVFRKEYKKIDVIYVKICVFSVLLFR
jgi:hypothetical protein